MIRYNKLGYVVLNVTDVEKSADFYKNVVGMEMTETPNQEIAFLSCSRDHHNVILQHSNQPGLKRVAFEMENYRSLKRLSKHLQKQGSRFGR